MSEPPVSAALAPRETEMIALEHLLLDAENPRFGHSVAGGLDQADILDHIVNTFGVDDVLSSIAINGYISAEPVVCRRDEGSSVATVVEGNRRLAACLILVGDDRAARQKSRSTQYRDIWLQHGAKQIDPIPAIVFDGADRKQALLSYLGVRHIASAQPWDSFAKAAWVARVVEENQLPLADVALMIGDQHRTIRRLLEGYYFIQQTIGAGEFNPQDSQRRGRGSVTDYPFSWVYTILGYSTARTYLGLEEREPRSPLLASDKLSRAGTITRAMFGDKSRGRSAAIEDSRELGDLALTLGDPDKVAMLESGKSVAEIMRLTKPIDQRLREGLTQVRTLQSEIVAGLSGEELATELAESLVNLSSVNRRTAEDIARRIAQAARGTSDG
ncbi:MAG TPA: hypothetical protein VGL58_17955 [Caulobacteraceae bacterium]|jgi:hypothetical protein